MGIMCGLCGKVLKGNTAQALMAHQRESDSCRPRVGAGEAPRIKALDEKVQELIEEGNRLATRGGSYEETERNARERAQAEEALKQARKDSKAEKQQVKALAMESLSAASWTQSLASAFAGDGDPRFARGDDSLDQRLASETVGLVSGQAFREKRLALEAEASAKRAREEEEERERAATEQQRKREKKQRREKQQRQGLSFEEVDE